MYEASHAVWEEHVHLLRLYQRRHFADAENECNALLNIGDAAANRPALPLPAYDQCLKASHLFNLLDARGVISVTERAAYIGRVRALAKACCEAWLAGSAESTEKPLSRIAGEGGRGREPAAG